LCPGFYPKVSPAIAERQRKITVSPLNAIFAKIPFMRKEPELDKELEEGLSGDGSEELYERLHLKVDKGQEPLRIDKFLVQRIENASRNKIQKALEAGMVLVNNRQVQPNYKIRPLDEIVLYSDKEAHGEEIVPEEIPLNIEYEDAEVMIINKPPGLVVHPASGNYTGTLINGVAWYLQQKNGTINEQTLPRFGLVHRIDKNTTGLMVLAKTERAVRSLARQFFDHTVRRQYMALVWGDLAEETGTIIAHVGRHRRFRKLFDAYPEGDHGKEAITHYKVLERFGYVTLVQCVLETGRTHQIRVHMQHIGHPLFNDDTYGGDKIVKGTVFSKYRQFVDNCFAICPRHALHAKTIGFIHPGTGEEMLFESELPQDMLQLIGKWRSYTGNKPI
jgi:23S rRNA pseudouridine1911/1915/1917 synthase